VADIEARRGNAESASASIEQFGYRQELKRSLSLLDLIVYGLLVIVTTSPMTTFGIVYNASHGMVPLVYAVGLIAMIFTALSYVMMSRAFPVAGSVYTYAGRGIGETAGFLAGWVMLLDYILGPVFVYVAIAVAIQAILPEVPRGVCIALSVAFSTIVNLLGIETTARLNRVLLCVQLLILALFLLLASVALVQGVAGAHLSTAPLFQPSEVSPSLVFGGLSIAVLSFLGFDAISTLSEESRGGPSAVGCATMVSLGVAAMLFIAQTYLASLFVLSQTSFAAGQATDGAIYIIAAIIGGLWFKIVVSFKFFFAGLPAALGAQVATARLLFSMARDGKLPRMLSRVHPTRKVPEIAILLVAAMHLGLGLVIANQLELLASMVNFGALSGFLMLHLSVIVHFTWRRKSRDWLWHLIVPLVGFAIIGYVLLNLAVQAKVAGIAWLMVGIVALMALRRTSDISGLILSTGASRGRSNTDDDAFESQNVAPRKRFSRFWENTFPDR
jgi:amino acid transporter